jgi:hypothetical protein
MTGQKQKAALALTGAVALASGAYALGAQADDGAAVAAGGGNPTAAFAHDRPGRPGGPFGGVLAEKLGVSEAKLRAALADIRGDLPKPREMRDEFAKELATELGSTEAKVKAALERIRAKHEAELKEHRDALAEELAKRLNLDVSKVKDALETPRGFRLERRRP